MFGFGGMGFGVRAKGVLDRRVFARLVFGSVKDVKFDNLSLQWKLRDSFIIVLLGGFKASLQCELKE